LPVIVKVHVFVLLPPLEHAPDQMASRPFVTLNVIDVPVLNDAEPEVPTLTLMPAGLDVTRSPLRPDAVTVSVAACDGGLTVNAAVFVTLLWVAEMVTGVDVETPDVAAVKVALVAPAATATLTGTVAAAVLLLESDTTMPPAGDALESVTVPVEFAPPATLAGFMLTACRLAGGGTGVTVSVVVLLTPLYVAVTVIGVLAATDEVVAANVALVAPAATVTLAGTVATAGLLLESDTSAPPLGAVAVRVAVPVDPFPPTTVEGLTETADNAGAVAVACGVKLRVDENGPNNPAALRARTRHHRRWAGNPPARVACETVTVGFAMNGAAIVDESSTWTS
jgi:hypothetical protein